MYHLKCEITLQMGNEIKKGFEHMLIHNRKELSKLKRYNKWKQINQYISIPTLILLFFIAIVLTVYISYEYMNYQFFVFDRFLTEFICYSIWCIINLKVSKGIIRKKYISIGVRNIILLCGAFVATLTVFLLNNFWHYLSFNSMFNWETPVAYWLFIKNDLLYTYYWGWIRYPCVYLCVLFVGVFSNSMFVLKLKQIIHNEIQVCNIRYTNAQFEESGTEIHSAKIIPFRLPDDKKDD